MLWFNLHTPRNADMVLLAKRGFKPPWWALDKKEGQLQGQLTLSCWNSIICSRGCTIKTTSVNYHFASGIIIPDTVCKPDLSTFCEDLSFPLTRIFKDIKMTSTLDFKGMGMPLVGVRHPNACKPQNLAPTSHPRLCFMAYSYLALQVMVSWAPSSSLVIAQGTKMSSERIRLGFFFLVVSAIPVAWEGLCNMSKGLVRKGRCHQELPVWSYPLQLAYEEGQHEPKERCSHAGAGQGY